MSQADNPRHAILKEANIPLEVVMLLIAGMAMLIAGLVLLAVARGILPYYENGLHGLLLIIFAMQIITLGKTPFGDWKRSTGVFAIGIALASLGMVTCFIPLANPFSRLLLILCFGPGNILLLLKMCFATDKLRTWLKYGGIFQHLIFSSFLVYGFAILIALMIWKQDLFSLPVTATLLLAFGASIFYLAIVLGIIYGAYPEAGNPIEGGLRLSTEQNFLLLMGVFMVLLGGLLIPVNLGLLPFSGSAQLGLLMVMFAVQMLAAGNTPIGAFRRSRLMIFFGLVFAGLGIVSCLVPGILVSALTLLVGVLNILGGLITLGKICLPRLKNPPPAQTPPILKKLFAVQLILNGLAITFGTSMLVAHLIPGLLIGLILAANGCVLLYLLRILIIVDGMSRQAAFAK